MFLFSLSPSPLSLKKNHNRIKNKIFKKEGSEFRHLLYQGQGGGDKQEVGVGHRQLGTDRGPRKSRKFLNYFVFAWFVDLHSSESGLESPVNLG